MTRSNYRSSAAPSRSRVREAHRAERSWKQELREAGNKKGCAMNVNLKSLIARLNETCRSALEGAAGLCLSRTNYDVDIEHYLLKLIERADTDLARIFRQSE